MSVKFTVQSPFNFSTYDYIIVFNTTGNGLTPLPNGGAQANYTSFSDAIVVSGNAGGGVTAVPVQFVRSTGTSLPPAVYALVVPPQNYNFSANSNSLGTQFQFSFRRAVFNQLITPTPSSSPTASPSASPTPGVSPVWKFNCFVTQTGSVGGSFGGSSGNYTPVDSLGIGGAQDTSFSSPNLDTDNTFDIVQNALGNTAPDGSSTIVSCEIANTK
jgi:hypothetical protein